MTTPLTGRTVSVGALDAATREQMWSCFDAVYEGVDRARFEADLGAKDDVVLIEDEGGVLRGFSTLATTVDALPEADAHRFVAIFSGDTVIAPGFWGQTALQGAFHAYVGAAHRAHPGLPIYWHLISKGYKTYLLLARNFPTFWPRREHPTPPRDAAVLDLLCQKRFGGAWDPARGTLRFAGPTSRLRGGVAPIEGAVADDPDVRFFVARNPGHAEGDELCCLGHVDRAFLESYRAKLERLRQGRG